MPRIVYDPPEEDESYLIDKPTQELLAYLYLYGKAHPSDILNHANYHEEEEVIDIIQNVLSRDAAGFVTMRYGSQLNIEGDQLREIQLTSGGKDFVEKHESEIAVPFSIETFARDMMKIEEEIREVLHRFEELIIDDELDQDRDGNLAELMDRMETYFEDIRRKLPNDE